MARPRDTLVVHRGRIAVIAAGAVGVQDKRAGPGQRAARSDAASLGAIDRCAPINPGAGAGAAHIAPGGGVVIVARCGVCELRVDAGSDTARTVAHRRGVAGSARAVNVAARVDGR